MADIESLKKEIDEVLKAVNAEKLEISKLRVRQTSSDFNLLQGVPAKKTDWTIQAFLEKHIKDPLSYIEHTSISAENELKKLQSLIENSTDVMRLRCDSLTQISSDDINDDAQQYLAQCSVCNGNLQFNLYFEIKNLDSTEVKLIDVKFNDLKHSADLNFFVQSCIKNNNIPHLIQELPNYSELNHFRSSLLKEIEKDFGSEIFLVKHHPQNGSLALHLLNPASAQKILELKWIIAFDSQTNNFVYGFSLHSEPSGQWLQIEHTELVKDIVECTEMSQRMVDNWKQLCSLVVNREN